MEYLRDSSDTGQNEDGFFNFKSIKEHRGSYSLSDPEYATIIYFLNGNLGRSLGNVQPTSRQISSTVKIQGNAGG